MLVRPPSKAFTSFSLSWKITVLKKTPPKDAESAPEDLDQASSLCPWQALRWSYHQPEDTQVNRWHDWEISWRSTWVGDMTESYPEETHEQVTRWRVILKKHISRGHDGELSWKNTWTGDMIDGYPEETHEQVTWQWVILKTFTRRWHEKRYP